MNSIDSERNTLDQSASTVETKMRAHGQIECIFTIVRPRLAREVARALRALSKSNFLIGAAGHFPAQIARQLFLRWRVMQPFLYFEAPLSPTLISGYRSFGRGGIVIS
jgi:hypothetical protein